MIKIELAGKNFISFDQEAKRLWNKSFFGEIEKNKVIYPSYEVLYLVEKGKAKVYKNKKEIGLRKLMSLLKNEIKRFLVYKDLRNKGFILKSGLKYGCDFLVYERGKNPLKHHSKWLLWIIEKEKIDKSGLIAKVRIAHSTAKMLLLAFIESNKIVYYELEWKKM